MEVEMRYDQKWKSIPAAPKEAKNLNGSFDCNICLDFANEPVVTLCGHLYCWPCIYKWFHVQSASLSSDEYPQCPVCKAEISHTTVVPLYGRGQSLSNPELEAKACSRDMGIPPRPPACGTRALLNAAEHPNHQLLPYRNPYQRPYATGYLGSEEPISSPSSLSQRNDRIANVFQPAVDGMFGEMVYARVFGDSQSLHTFPNSYNVVGSSNPRLRRQEMQVHKSLNRVSIFLICCFILCLAFF
ncbi:E3 ubiquitin-protein ligase RMA1H1-like [Chenopodium quinoa]|uniref:E3 ubiquitin-protein ligase RMA1H1-like n=1 Tax=Chenopodium quinoa TaxID=63459 RepID=UPI000B784470|nr:E3 ubiquitin-protein ligase RMA1H1-like [Chenopodium quinoa]XP_021740590.1 E3 ubiquitin-protein ligase RMA1H1-like [Chenopodium quinoa]